jgi:hypothetical protein
VTPVPKKANPPPAPEPQAEPAKESGVEPAKKVDPREDDRARAAAAAAASSRARAERLARQAEARKGGARNQYAVTWPLSPGRRRQVDLTIARGGSHRFHAACTDAAKPEAATKTLWLTLRQAVELVEQGYRLDPDPTAPTKAKAKKAPPKRSEPAPASGEE